MANSNVNPVLYWSGTMLDSDASVDTQIQNTGASGMKTVLLWSLHVQSQTTSKRTLGDLVWNDTLIVASVNGVPTFDPENQFSKLADRLKTLLGASTSVYNVFFSIGAGGVSDFTTVQQLLSTPAGTETLVNNFQVLQDNLPMISGYDFDDEDNYDIDTIADFTVLLYNKFGSIITYCPYWNMNFWESCMERVYSNLNQQPVAWWNLQCYSGGDGNNPLDWVNLIASNQNANGVPDANAFIVPGYAAQNQEGDGPGLCPSDICTMFKGYQEQVPGGFIWNSQHVFDNTVQCDNGLSTMTDYASAIINGLSGNC